MRKKCNVRIDHKHFQEMHHALGCPWPDEIMGETSRNHFACDGTHGSTSDRMRSSAHWSNGSGKFGMTYFHVTDAGKSALREYMRQNISTPALYSITYKHHEGENIVSAKSRSAARYAAYLNAGIERPFIEYAAEIKYVKIHTRAHVAPQAIQPT
tara:strand:+ start:5086 stop:5550 length:465 start_codon:yes stop_codon:yes gene_type:complete